MCSCPGDCGGGPECLDDGFASLVDRLGDIIARLAPQPRRELLCGPGVIMWLRVLTPEDDPSFPWSQTPPFTGIPLIHAPDLGRGEWELHEDGEAVGRGRFDLPEPPDFRSIPMPAVFGFLNRPVPLAPGLTL